MTRRTKMILLSVLSFVLLSGLAAFVYLEFFWKLDLFPPEHPIKAVKTEGWPKINVGMTKQQVAALLGEAEEQGSLGISRGGKKEEPSEWWAYNWSGSLGPSSRAYVVYFDSQGRVYSFSSPKLESHAELRSR